jgi:Mlc titration factor MtfA (ptsG expression regulator)
MIGDFLSRMMRRQVPAAIPDVLWHEVVSQLPFIASLPASDLDRLRVMTQAFLAEKEFSSTGGLELDDTMMLTIAVQACLPILNLGLEWYDDWVGIVVYPDEFVIPRSIADETGVVHEYDELASGEAWGGGPVLVSWNDVKMAGSGYNVVIHEFVHKIDMRNGDADGIPPMPAAHRESWQTVLHAAYDDFCEELDAADEAGLDTAIDPYAAEHPGEFFAVLAEAFFETPIVIKNRYPELYDAFARFFRCDPLHIRYRQF